MTIMIVPAISTSGIVKPDAGPLVRIRSLNFRVDISFISAHQIYGSTVSGLTIVAAGTGTTAGAPNVGTVADPRKRFTVPVGVTSKKFAVASDGLEQSTLQT